MANHQVKNAAAATVYLKSTGAGTDLDPHIIEHLETNSAAIKTAVETLVDAIAGSEMQVDVVSSALPSGASTSAKQDTANTALAAIQAAVEILDNIVSGSEAQVDIVGALPAGNNNIGDVDVLSIAAGDNNIGNVDIVSLPASTNTLEIVGDVAHDAAVAGNPVLMGGIAETTADSAPGNRASADGDAVRLAVDRDGALYVLPHGAQTWSYHEDSSSALTDAEVHAAPGAGLSLYVTDIVVSTGAATALNAFLEEGSTKVLGPYYLEAVAGRGLHISFRTPKKITANTALTITTSAAIAHGVDITGYIAPG